MGLDSADEVGEVDEAQTGGAEDDSKGVIENHDIETARDRHIDPHARDSRRPGSHSERSLPLRTIDPQLFAKRRHDAFSVAPMSCSAQSAEQHVSQMDVSDRRSAESLGRSRAGVGPDGPRPTCSRFRHGRPLEKDRVGLSSP